MPTRVACFQIIAMRRGHSRGRSYRSRGLERERWYGSVVVVVVVDVGE